MEPQVVKSTELRMNNILHYDDDDGEGKSLAVRTITYYNGEPFVNGARVSSTGHFAEQDSSLVSKWKPIPLTERMLISAGFKKWGRDDIPSTVTFEFDGWITIAPLRRYFGYDGDGFGYHWTKTKENDPESWRAKVELMYVHQLQNFIFVMTGKELKITL